MIKEFRSVVQEICQKREEMQRDKSKNGEESVAQTDNEQRVVTPVVKRPLLEGHQWFDHSFARQAEGDQETDPYQPGSFLS